MRDGILRYVIKGGRLRVTFTEALAMRVKVIFYNILIKNIEGFSFLVASSKTGAQLYKHSCPCVCMYVCVLVCVCVYVCMSVRNECFSPINHEQMIESWWNLYLELISMRCWSWPKVKVTRSKVKVIWPWVNFFVSLISILYVSIINIQPSNHDL